MAKWSAKGLQGRAPVIKQPSTRYLIPVFGCSKPTAYMLVYVKWVLDLEY